MMTNDKEPLESTQVASQHHRPGMYPPSLTSKPTNGKSDSIEPDGGSLSAPASYYQSVTTKGKLILPTAFWVLIILAGVCFLSLFTTLNKTLGTLNVLVELEQEQANSKLDSSRQAAWEHRENHHHNHHHDKLVQEPKAMLLQTGGGGSSSPGNSNDQLTPWSSSFAFPSWTSLEPSRRKHLSKAPEHGTQEHGGQKSADEEIKSFLDDMMRASNNDGLIGGGIIVASSSVSSSDETDSPGIGLPPSSPSISDFSGPLSSIFSQIIGEQIASTAQPHKASRDLPGNFDFENLDNNKEKSKQDDSDDIGSGPLITANIGRLNINLNTPNDDDSDERPTIKPREKGEHPRRPMMVESPAEFGPFPTNQIPSRSPPSDTEAKNLEMLMNLLLSPPGQPMNPMNSGIELSPDGGLLVSFDTPFEPERRPIRPPAAHKHDHDHHDHHHHLGQGHLRPTSRSRGQDHGPVSIESAGPDMLMPADIFPSSVFGLPSGASPDPPLFIALEIDSREPEGSSRARPLLPSPGDEPQRPMGSNSPYELLSMPDLFTGPEVRPGGRPKPHAHKSDMDEVDTTLANGKVDDRSSKKLGVKNIIDAFGPMMFGPEFIEPNEMPGRIHIISDDGPQPGKGNEEQKSIFADIVSKENTGVGNKEPERPSPTTDLFDLMFGPPPSSKLTVKPSDVVQEPADVVLAQTTRKPSGETEQTGEQGNLFIPPLSVDISGPQAVVDDNTSTTSPPTSTTSSPNRASSSSLAEEEKKVTQPSSGPTQEEREELEKFADGFMNIFSLPQMANEQAPKKVEVLETAAQQSGSAGSGSSDTNTVSASPLATTLSSSTSSNIRDSIQAKKSDLNEDLKFLTDSTGSTQSMQPVTPTIVTPMASMQVNKVTEPSIDHGNLETTTASHMVPPTQVTIETSPTTPEPEVTETNPQTSEPENFSTPPTFTTGSLPADEQETTTTTHHAITAPSLTTSEDSSQSQSTIEVDRTTTMAPRVHEESGVTSTTTKKPSKSFLQKADDFIGRNIFDFRRFLH